MRFSLMTLVFAWVVPAAISTTNLEPAKTSRASGNSDQALDTCLVEITGDVNVSGTITSADVIYLVRFIFLVGPPPEPCFGAGDVTCNGTITAADVIRLVNYVFKSGPEPCDICQSEHPSGCVQLPISPSILQMWYMR